MPETGTTRLLSDSDLAIYKSHQADEHEAKQEQHNSKRPRVGADITESSAKVFDLENGIVGE